jgi:PAP2 superfamily
MTFAAPFVGARLKRAVHVLLGVGAGASLVLGAGVARGDAVLDWNEISLKTTAAAPFDPPRESRSLALVHAAVFDAVRAIVGGFHSYACELIVAPSASPEAAAIAAAHQVLVRLYPAQQAALDTAYARSLSVIPPGQATADGVSVGDAVAACLLRLRADDGAARADSSDPGGDHLGKPGIWSPTPPRFAPALDPGWGKVRPFVLRDGSQFRPEPPPSFDDPRYGRDFAEIQAIGSATSAIRTQAQTALARFWIATAPQNWNPLARQLSRARHLTLSENARAFALLNLACADAFIAAWDAKFTFGQWRPVSAIRRADEDGNPETAPDPSWTPLLMTPPFPDYIAGHTAYAGAAAAVLEHLFGRRPGIALTITSPSAPGVVEIYATFEEIAESVVDARVWGGVHWRTSSERGKEVGRRVGQYVIDHCCTPVRRANR